MKTNANIPEVAQYFKGQRPSANFTSLIIRKKGVKRGGKVYGDDKVHSVFITGFSYKKLCKRSLKVLKKIKSKEILKELQTKYPNMVLAQIITARADLRESLKRSAKGSNSTRSFDPLRINGKVIKGCKVYSGIGEPSDSRAPVPGTIYVRGLCIGNTILERAANGRPPIPCSDYNTIIKKHIRYQLPIGRYISYALTPGQDFELKIGGQARLAVEQNKVRLG